MRCSCHICDTYMVHAESVQLGCVCPNCGARCKACLGTDSVVSREVLESWKRNPAAFEEPFLTFDSLDGCLPPRDTQ